MEWGYPGDKDYAFWDTPKFWVDEIPVDGAVNLEGLSLSSSDNGWSNDSGTTSDNRPYDYSITLDVNDIVTFTATTEPADGTENATIDWAAVRNEANAFEFTSGTKAKSVTIKALNATNSNQPAFLTCTAQNGSRTITKTICVTINQSPTITGLKLGDQELKPAADGTYAAEMLYTANNNKGQELAVELSGASEEMLKNVKLTVDGGKSAKNGKPLMKVEPSGNVVTLTPDPTQIAYAVNEAKGNPVVATFTIGVAGSKDDKETLKITLKLKQGDKSDSGIFSQTPAKKK